LLHDIGHLPAGHTLEDELHLVDGHDEVARLNLVLDRDDWPGSDAPPLRQIINDAFGRFLTDEAVTPVDLLIQIIAKDAPSIVTFPSGFRIGICQDIVGNTICADLLDYLHRDWYHIGKPKYYEQRLLQYMEIRENAEKEPNFVISLGERPNVKTDAISTILDLLESRYQLAESVLFHRAKCSAAAMCFVIERGEAKFGNDVRFAQWHIAQAKSAFHSCNLFGKYAINSFDFAGVTILFWRPIDSRVPTRSPANLAGLTIYITRLPPATCLTGGGVPPRRALPPSPRLRRDRRVGHAAQRCKNPTEMNPAGF
jgi:hypothetical protein